MFQQGPILVVSSGPFPSTAALLDKAQLFPVIETDWADAVRAVAQTQPAAIIVSATEISGPGLAELAECIAPLQPYLPLIATDPVGALPDTVIPVQTLGNSARLIARLRVALRVRALHATVMRRLDSVTACPMLADIEPARDATVLLIGRGAAYPTLSVSLGEQIGLVGALSIEAAAKHLNSRDLDGIVLGEGFSLRVMDAFLTVLMEDSRFRNMPVVMTSDELAPAYDLPNLEICAADPARVVAVALPLIRQHAFESHLGRTLRSIDAEGLVDPHTGLLTSVAFDRDFATSVYQMQERGGGLSVARFAFDPLHSRARFDGARIISRLMRKMDFGALQEDGSVIVVFADTDLRNAHMIARRLSSVMRHTSHGRREARAEPAVTVATLLPADSAKSLLARLCDGGRRAAS